MEPFKFPKAIGLIILVIGCQGVTAGFAMDGERSPQQPEVSNKLRNTLPSSGFRYMNVEGMLRKIQGNMYIIEGTSTDQPIQVQVGKDTAFPNGQKEPGQPVQALVSAQDGRALIIR